MSTLLLISLRLRGHNIRTLGTLSYSSQPKRECKKDLCKVVNVAIIGAPNAGKSTLINKITERKICAASNKVHTTTKLVRAMCYEQDTQIIFLDTPGIVTEKEQKKYNLPDSMLAACEKSLRCADVVGVVHDVSNKWTKDNLHSDVINMLEMIKHIPSFLILNKVDMLKTKKQLLAIIRNLTNGIIAGNPIPNATKNKKVEERGYSHFSDVFLVSALNGDGVHDIKKYLIDNSKLRSLHYSATEWSDQTPETLIEEAVRAKFLDFLAQEIPYNLKTQLEYFDNIKHEDKIICSVSVECPTERLARLISGAGGGRLQQIKSHVRNDLIDMFKKTVVIDIRLKVKSKPPSEETLRF
ncbi:GTPase Era, mitochondrial-like [Maniola hyperantus]|uniref:GTPase Era, mitochondrial-like n=1 Tax=Aphantopus hyperantus TaxID=2795564 RepID=UPI001569686F|nr:GTPase Era, mitochondrial [Maniola hyperantus]